MGVRTLATRRSPLASGMFVRVTGCPSASCSDVALTGAGLVVDPTRRPENGAYHRPAPASGDG